MKIKPRMQWLRQFAILSILGGAVYAASSKEAWGTFCDICPIGLLGVSVASNVLLPQAMVLIGLEILAVVVLGKFFCSWLCPTALLPRNNGPHVSAEQQATAKTSLASGIGVLGAALLSTLIVGFPIFCLVCPIGLVFVFIFAVYKLFSIYQPGWELIVIPLVLAAELLFFKSWCRSYCAVGAFMNIISRLFRFGPSPMINDETCLAANGCHVCKTNCPEHLDLPHDSATAMDNCTLCLECYEKCPQNAVGIGLSKPASNLRDISINDISRRSSNE
ncbi:MAG: 4Fe-4S binding protein [Sporomusaceae bacterium]|nr:4Fe-4S binding protein [Sporomusaceae bacterium]